MKKDSTLTENPEPIFGVFPHDGFFDNMSNYVLCFTCVLLKNVNATSDNTKCY